MSGEPFPAGSDRTGRRDLTRQIPTGNGWNGPAMRPKPPHAAGSGVGKHKARESEAPNIVPSGKSAWRTPTPKFGPGTARFRGLIVFADRFTVVWTRAGHGRHGYAGGAQGLPPITASRPYAAPTVSRARRAAAYHSVARRARRYNIRYESGSADRPSAFGLAFSIGGRHVLLFSKDRTRPRHEPEHP